MIARRPGRWRLAGWVLTLSGCGITVQLSNPPTPTPGCPFTSRELLSTVTLPISGDQCLPVALTPESVGGMPGQPSTVRCVLDESSTTVMLTDWCTSNHGRQVVGTTCLVNQVPTMAGQPTPSGSHGFYYVSQSMIPGCLGRVIDTSGDEPPSGVVASLDCLQVVQGVPNGSPTCGIAPTGGACTPLQGNTVACTPSPQNSTCFQDTQVFLEVGSSECGSGACLVYHDAEATAPGERASHVHCTCRCGVPADLLASVDPSTLCACPIGYTCVQNLFGVPFDTSIQGSYCVNNAAIAPP